MLDAGEHTLTAVFIPADEKNFLRVTVQVRLTVQKVYPQLKWENPENIVFGTRLNSSQLCAETVDSSIWGELTYRPDFETLLECGEHDLTVDFSPFSSNYLCSQMSVRIVVERRVPQVRWSTPANITWPSPLSAQELNARCLDSEIDGSFTYNPSQGKKNDQKFFGTSQFFFGVFKLYFVFQNFEFTDLVMFRNGSGPRGLPCLNLPISALRKPSLQ